MAFLIGMAVNAAIDYGIQVAMNYAAGYKGKDAWVNKVDFFDVAVSGGIGGLTMGWGAAIKQGQAVGKLGMFMAKSSSLVTLGEIGLTSAVDITGEGWQPVSFNDFGKRVVIGVGTYYGTKAISKAFSNKNTKVSYNNGNEDLPIQKHHFATNKNKVYTSQMERIAQNYGLDLDGDWNKELMKHLGRHPNEYHNFVLKGMQRAAIEAGGDQAKFIKLFNLYVKQVIIDNPLLLRKSGW